MTKMNKILGFNEELGIVSTEAGAILSELQDFTLAYGYEMPHDIGSRGSCLIGGNLATNAGGTKQMKNNSL